jgi:hypothetical protein
MLEKSATRVTSIDARVVARNPISPPSRPKSESI